MTPVQKVNKENHESTVQCLVAIVTSLDKKFNHLVSKEYKEALGKRLQHLVSEDFLNDKLHSLKD